MRRCQDSPVTASIGICVLKNLFPANAVGLNTVNRLAHKTAFQMLRKKFPAQNAQIVNAMPQSMWRDYFHTRSHVEFGKLAGSLGRLPSHVEANTRALFELFAQYDVKATFFFLGWVAERFQELWEARDLDLAETGCSTATGIVRVQAFSSQEFWDDTYRSRSVLGGCHTEKAVFGYRAPNFSINDSVPWSLSDSGRAGICMTPAFSRSVMDYTEITARYGSLIWFVQTCLNCRLRPGGFCIIISPSAVALTCKEILPFELMKNGICGRLTRDACAGDNVQSRKIL